MGKFLFWTFLLASTASFASRKTIKEVSFQNKDCLKTDSCDLKSFYMKISEDKGSNSQELLSSATFMEGFYETSSISMLEEYAVVQFIKGCNYKTGLRDNEVHYQSLMLREFFGKKNQKFNHYDWVVDSIDYDPIYKSSYENSSRHGSYKVLFDETKSIIFDHTKYSEFYFYNPPMNKPRLYFSDMPTGGSLSKVIVPSAGNDQGKAIQSYINSSLIFKTCIYKTKDVDIDAGPNGVDLNKAIHCFEWSSSHQINDSKTAFVSKDTIDPVCTSLK